MLVSRTTNMVAARPVRRSAVRCAAGKQEGAPKPAQVSRRLLVGGGLLASSAAGAAKAEVDERKGDRVVHTEQEWKQLLTSEQYRVLREAGTELPRTSPLNNEKRRGTFVCAGCGSPLFTSESKYNSGTGWPSFFNAIDGATVNTIDNSFPFYPRTEVRCKACGGHLGHVFDDGPPPTGLRYCMNGLALLFEPAEEAPRA